MSLAPFLSPGLSNQAAALCPALLFTVKRWCWIQNRGISSSITKVPIGLNPNKVGVVPFKKSETEALEAYNGYHTTFLTYPPSGSPQANKTLLPFWAAEAKLLVRVRAARLEKDDTYGSKTRSQTLRWSKNDKNAPSWVDSFQSTDKDMQVYASYKYLKSHVDGVKTNGMFEDACKWNNTPEDVVVDQFQILPTVARKLIMEAMHKSCLSYAEKLLVKDFQVQKVADVHLDFEFHKFHLSPVYVPAYVFEDTYLGRTLHTFVHGATLATSGPRLYNSHLTIAASGASMAFVPFVEHYLPGPATITLPAMVILAADALRILHPVLENWSKNWLANHSRDGKNNVKSNESDESDEWDAQDVVSFDKVVGDQLIVVHEKNSVVNIPGRQKSVSREFGPLGRAIQRFVVGTGRAVLHIAIKTAVHTAINVGMNAIFGGKSGGGGNGGKSGMETVDKTADKHGVELEDDENMGVEMWEEKDTFFSDKDESWDDHDGE